MKEVLGRHVAKERTSRPHPPRWSFGPASSSAPCGQVRPAAPALGASQDGDVVVVQVRGRFLAATAGLAPLIARGRPGLLRNRPDARMRARGRPAAPGRPAPASSRRGRLGQGRDHGSRIPATRWRRPGRARRAGPAAKAEVSRGARSPPHGRSLAEGGDDQRRERLDPVECGRQVTQGDGRVVVVLGRPTATRTAARHGRPLSEQRRLPVARRCDQRGPSELSARRRLTRLVRETARPDGRRGLRLEDVERALAAGPAATSAAARAAAAPRSERGVSCLADGASISRHGPCRVGAEEIVCRPAGGCTRRISGGHRRSAQVQPGGLRGRRHLAARRRRLGRRGHRAEGTAPEALVVRGAVTV